MKKISCGGFYINEDDFSIDEEGKLNLKPNRGGCGYTIDETRTVIIPEQTVTTESVEDSVFKLVVLAFAGGITVYPKVGDTLSITINGETKDVVGVESNADFFDGTIFYFSGSLPDDLPIIAVAINNAEAGLVTVGLSAATYTISAELVTRAMTVSPEFQGAVAKSTEPLVLTCEFTSANEGTHNSTAAELDQAIRSNREIIAVTQFGGQNLRLKMQYAVMDNGYYLPLFIAVDNQSHVMFVTNTVARTADDNAFVVSFYELTSFTPS